MSILFIRLYYKEVRMSDPKNDSKNSKGTIGFGIESDKGSWPLSNKGEQPPPPSSQMPQLKKPKK